MVGSKYFVFECLRLGLNGSWTTEKWRIVKCNTWMIPSLLLIRSRLQDEPAAAKSFQFCPSSSFCLTAGMRWDNCGVDNVVYPVVSKAEAATVVVKVNKVLDSTADSAALASLAGIVVANHSVGS